MYDLLSKYVAGEISPEERKKLLDALQEDPELRKEAAYLQNISGLVALASGKELASDKQYNSFVGTRRKRMFFFHLRKVGGYAAVMLLSIFCTYMFMEVFKGENVKVAYQEFITPPGQRAKVLLADGTEVWLNANSRLRYPESFKAERRVVELHGEAFFEVKQNKKKPFVVQTKKMDILVTGTKFNVFAYDREKFFVTSLVEGQVIVSRPGHLDHEFILQPNQQILVSDSSSHICSFNNSDFLLWKEGIFMFDDMPLDDIIKKLELYYDVSIIANNKVLGNFRYTGKFRQRDGVESVLRKLQIVYPFTYKKDDEKNRITLQ